MRIFTCTPACFVGDETFFGRDTGLLSEGFRALGVQSRPIMLAPERSREDPRILRASMQQLSDPTWWRALQLDGLVLYSWALPRFTPVAAAVRAASIRLMIYLDSAGLWSPRVQGRDYCRALWTNKLNRKGGVFGPGLFLASMAKNLWPRFFDLPRLRHLAFAHAIGLPSPLALERTAAFARHYRREELSSRLHCVGAPVHPSMQYSGCPKEKLLICVGRWTRGDWPQKDPRLLLRATELFLEAVPDHRVMIVGAGAEALKSSGFVRQSLFKNPRLELSGVLRKENVAKALNRARISICSSPSEAAHLASMEAVCCGCSVVAKNSPALPIFHWLGEANGTLAAGSSPAEFSEAMTKEAAAWVKGDRNAAATSARWGQILHAPRIAEQIIRLLGLPQGGSFRGW